MLVSKYIQQAQYDNLGWPHICDYCGFDDVLIMEMIKLYSIIGENLYSILHILHIADDIYI